jgi:broad specificity phosphatase PhoE
VLIVVRHGQTAPNRSGLLLGRSDPPLTALGRDQADAACAAVRARGDVAAVITSPLLRARQTAERFGLPVEVDERWTELDYGGLEGQPFASVPASLWARWRADPELVPDGGESLAALGRRVREACGQLAARAAADHVVVVSHVSPIKAAVAWALGVADDVVWRMHCDVASISRIAVTGSRPVLHSYNEVGHVGAKGAGGRADPVGGVGHGTDPPPSPNG